MSDFTENQSENLSENQTPENLSENLSENQPETQPVSTPASFTITVNGTELDKQIVEYIIGKFNEAKQELVEIDADFATKYPKLYKTILLKKYLANQESNESTYQEVISIRNAVDDDTNYDINGALTTAEKQMDDVESSPTMGGKKSRKSRTKWSKKSQIKRSKKSRTRKN